MNNAFIIWCKMVNDEQFLQREAAFTVEILQRSRFRTHSIPTTPASINSNQISRSGPTILCNCSSRPAAVSLKSKTNHQLPLNPSSKILPVGLDLHHHPRGAPQLSGLSVERKPNRILGLSLWVYEILTDNNVMGTVQWAMTKLIWLLLNSFLR